MNDWEGNIKGQSAESKEPWRIDPAFSPNEELATCALWEFRIAVDQ